MEYLHNVLLGVAKKLVITTTQIVDKDGLTILQDLVDKFQFKSAALERISGVRLIKYVHSVTKLKQHGLFIFHHQLALRVGTTSPLKEKTLNESSDFSLS